MTEEKKEMERGRYLFRKSVMTENEKDEKRQKRNAKRLDMSTDELNDEREKNRKKRAELTSDDLIEEREKNRKKRAELTSDDLIEEREKNCKKRAERTSDDLIEEREKNRKKRTELTSDDLNEERERNYKKRLAMSSTELEHEKEKNKNKWQSTSPEKKEMIKEKIKNKRKDEKEKQNQTDIDAQISHVAATCLKEMLQFRKFCCSVCQRMFRKKGVKKLNKLVLLQQCDSSFRPIMEKCLSYTPKNAQENGEFICHTCNRNLKKNKMPSLALANMLELKPIPKSLLNLCDLELHLLALILPFSKTVGLRGGTYQGVKGESVYVPIDPDVVCNTVSSLPRKLTDPHLIPLKLKRRLRYRGYFMFQTIRKTNVEEALDWLVKNNPHYSHISKDPNWFTVDSSNPNAEAYLKLTSEDDIHPDVIPHEGDDSELINSMNDNDENSKNETEDEVDGKNLLYDSVFVDKVPSLPIKDDGNSFSIAPGEDKRPVSRISDSIDQMAYPGIFPYGEASFSQKREVSLSIGKYYQSLLQRQDSRCTKASFIFHAQNQVENN